MCRGSQEGTLGVLFWLRRMEGRLKLEGREQRPILGEAILLRLTVMSMYAKLNFTSNLESDRYS